jgi:virginiamycin A acetyltransferase
MLRRLVKTGVSALSCVVAFPFALLAGFGRVKPAFILCAQALAILPGLPGDYVRRGYYTFTLRKFSFANRIGFGSYFSEPEASLDELAAVGEYCIIGKAEIGARTLIAAHSNILSGARHHLRDEEGKLTVEGSYTTVTIGDDVWIGTGSVVMAHVGPRSTVGAGSIVFRDVPADVVVTGNPARVVDKRLPAAQASASS